MSNYYQHYKFIKQGHRVVKLSCRLCILCDSIFAHSGYKKRPFNDTAVIRGQEGKKK
jgi:hypothetical protein